MPVTDLTTWLHAAFPAVGEWEDLGDNLLRGWERTAWRYVLFGGERFASVTVAEEFACRTGLDVEAYVRRKLAAKIERDGSDR